MGNTMGAVWKRIQEEKAIVISVIVTLFVVILIGILASVAMKSAGMRILQGQGSIVLSGKDGKQKTISDSGRVDDGDIISSGQDSWVQLELDSSKKITLESNSSLTLHKDGKKYTIDLTKGDLFFSVSKHLESGESLKVCTPSMMLDIKGTSGYSLIDENGEEWFYLFDGKVKVTVTNPYTGEVASKDIFEGHKVTVKFYENATEDRESVVFVVKDLTEKDIPEPVLREFYQDKILLRRVVIATGMSEEVLRRMAANAMGEPLPEENPEDDLLEEEVLEEQEEEMTEQEEAAEEEDADSHEEDGDGNQTDSDTNSTNRNNNTQNNNTQNNRNSTQNQNNTQNNHLNNNSNNNSNSNHNNTADNNTNNNNSNSNNAGNNNNNNNNNSNNNNNNNNSNNSNNNNPPEQNNGASNEGNGGNGGGNTPENSQTPNGNAGGNEETSVSENN